MDGWYAIEVGPDREHVERKGPWFGRRNTEKWARRARADGHAWVEVIRVR